MVKLWYNYRERSKKYRPVKGGEIQDELPYIKFIREMLLFRRNSLRVLYTTYDRGHSDRIGRADSLEAEKDHRYTDSYLPAL